MTPNCLHTVILATTAVMFGGTPLLSVVAAQGEVGSPDGASVAVDPQLAQSGFASPLSAVEAFPGGRTAILAVEYRSRERDADPEVEASWRSQSLTMAVRPGDGYLSKKTTTESNGTTSDAGVQGAMVVENALLTFGGPSSRITLVPSRDLDRFHPSVSLFGPDAILAILGLSQTWVAEVPLRMDIDEDGTATLRYASNGNREVWERDVDGVVTGYMRLLAATNVETGDVEGWAYGLQATRTGPNSFEATVYDRVIEFTYDLDWQDCSLAEAAEAAGVELADAAVEIKAQVAE